MKNLMMYRCLGLLAVGLSLFFVGCKDKRVINDRIALNEIKYHLENNPVYETTTLDYGEVRFSKKSDSALMDAYEHLEDFGYVKLELVNERKRFLSRDSVFKYIVHLTDKSIPYVLDKTADKATVKTYYYELDESEPALLEQTGKNRAKATVTLKQRETDFSMFASKNRASSASFIKKTYNFRFDENSGWRIAP